MKLFKFALNTALFLVAAFYLPVASACSFVAWTGGSSGAVEANDPNSTSGIPRIGGFCGMEVTGTGHVEDQNPAADESFLARFYFLPDFTVGNSGQPIPAKIFVAYKDDAATMELFSILFDGTSLIFDASGADGGTTSPPVAADLTHWNLIEFEWVSGSAGNFWVDADALAGDTPSATFTPGTGAVNTIRLGLPDGLGTLSGMGTFDDYQSQRTLHVGPLQNGDANDDASVDAGDINAIINEFLSGTLGPGFADCNQDSNVDAGDINCIIAIFLG